MANTLGALQLQAKHGLSDKAMQLIDTAVVGTVLVMTYCIAERKSFQSANISDSEWTQELAAYIAELEHTVADRRHAANLKEV